MIAEESFIRWINWLLNFVLIDLVSHKDRFKSVSEF